MIPFVFSFPSWFISLYSCYLPHQKLLVGSSYELLQLNASVHYLFWQRTFFIKISPMSTFESKTNYLVHACIIKSEFNRIERYSHHLRTISENKPSKRLDAHQNPQSSLFSKHINHRGIEKVHLVCLLSRVTGDVISAFIRKKHLQQQQQPGKGARERKRERRPQGRVLEPRARARKGVTRGPYILPGTLIAVAATANDRFRNLSDSW